MRIIFHIGSPKTGTTSLQGFLSKNDDALRANGIHYLKSFRRGINHNYMNMLLDQGEKKFVLRKLTNELRNSDASTLILSGEVFFFPAMTRRLAKIFSEEFRDQLEIICYLRRQDLFAESLYKQHLKKSMVEETTEDFLGVSLSHLTYARLLSHHIKAIGKEKMHVTPYEKNRLYKGDIIADFLKRIGAKESDDYVFPQKMANPTPSYPLSLALSKINWQSPMERRQCLRALQQHGAPGLHANDDILTLEERHQYAERFARENTRLRRLFSPERESFFEAPGGHNTPLSKIEMPQKIEEYIKLIETLRKSL